MAKMVASTLRARIAGSTRASVGDAWTRRPPASWSVDRAWPSICMLDACFCRHLRRLYAYMHDLLAAGDTPVHPLKGFKLPVWPVDGVGVETPCLLPLRQARSAHSRVPVHLVCPVSCCGRRRVVSKNELVPASQEHWQFSEGGTSGGHRRGDALLSVGLCGRRVDDEWGSVGNKEGKAGAIRDHRPPKRMSIYRHPHMTSLLAVVRYLFVRHDALCPTTPRMATHTVPSVLKRRKRP